MSNWYVLCWDGHLSDSCRVGDSMFKSREIAEASALRLMQRYEEHDILPPGTPIPVPLELFRRSRK